MKDKELTRLSFIFLHYIYMRKAVLGAITLFTVTFLITSVLYHIPAEPVQYAFLLSGIMSLLWFLRDFFSYYKNHLNLVRVMKEDTILPENLIPSKHLTEMDYQTIIQIQHERSTKILADAQAKRIELMDYYTMWAHQIKVPISAMGVLLQTDYVDGRSEAISQELFKIEQYVEMALYYLRIENMSSDLLLKEYNLYDLVKQAVRKYSVLFIYKKISLSLEEIDYKVVTDEKWLVFVLEQILANAIKYTKTGTVSIYMDKEKEETLVIEDTGIGIRAEDVPRIFDRGFTGYNGRQDKKSTGLGLYLTKEILDKLSHTISVTSDLGKGTKVFIGLQMKKIYIE